MLWAQKDLHTHCEEEQTFSYCASRSFTKIGKEQIHKEMNSVIAIQ
jgi:hypothetical protein